MKNGSAMKRGVRRRFWALTQQVWALAVVALLLVGCSASPEVTIQHIHGLGFTADGQQLYVPAHDGFVIFAGGKWQVPAVPKHDYMGYVAIDQGFYSSGHPAPGTGLQDPLGLVKSLDGGKTITPLGFQGQIDFHSMGAGYYSHAVYVFNPVHVASLAAGMHSTIDDGKTWRPSALRGIRSAPFQVAVHPTKPELVALATQEGLFLSMDYGDRFVQVGDQAPITTVSFSPDGQRLVYGFRQLYAASLEGGQVSTLPSPIVAPPDAMGYIAISPVQANEIVLGTFNREIYRSVDGGQTWKQIATKGKGHASR